MNPQSEIDGVANRASERASDSERNIVSRRRVVGLVSAAMGSAWLGASASAADDSNASSPASKTTAELVYNIRDFGAKGDGTTLDTAAIQAAIDAANRDRGGIVLVPAGDFLCGTVQLKSNVTLHLSAQGRILGSGKIQDYSAGKGIPPSNGNFALLYAADAENVTVEGRGTIDGQGVNFYNGVGDGTGPGGSQGPRNVERPHLLIFSKCKNVLLRDAFFTRSAYHCCRILQCQYVHIDGIRIYNRVNKNNDGFHFNSSQYVNIANCNISCQDDACACLAAINSLPSQTARSALAGRSSDSAAARRRISPFPIVSFTKPMAARSKCPAARARGSRT